MAQEIINEFATRDTRRRRFLDGVWAAAEGLVYAFADAHRLPADWRPPTHWARVWGIDWGQRAPSVLQVWAVDPDSGLYLYREVFKTHCRADQLGKLARGWLDLGTEPTPLAVVCDHNPEEKEMFERETGLALTMADKTDRDEGIQATQARFDHGAGCDGVPVLPPRIRFRDNALDHTPDQFLLDEGRPTSTVAELTGYTWDPKFLRDTPKADNDHGCDAMRYVVAWVDANLGGPHGETRYGYDRDAQMYPAYLR
ncbi:MAG: hypothetical protein JWO38_6111 [Gemmataceae bacterium]|nr:hypothetical protein [Gemmataceae bacterium]